jgi:hypothetical protein
MNVHRIAALTVSLAVGVALAGCSDASDAEPTPAITATTSESRSGTARAEHDGGDGVGDQEAETAEDRLTVEPAEQLRGYPAENGEFIPSRRRHVPHRLPTVAGR